MPTTIKRIILMLLTLLLCVSGSIVTYAQTSKEETLNNAELELQQKKNIVEQKEQEKLVVNQEIDSIQQNLVGLYTEITTNKEEMAKTQQKIDESKQLIEKEKEKIVFHEDKILARKGIMKQRAMSLQQNDSVNVMIDIFFNSESISDLIQRASAVSALMDADKDILIAQKEDLLQIEKDKKEIDRQEKILEEDQQVIAKQQVELDQNLATRQQSLTIMQEKYSKVLEEVALAEQDKAGIELQMKDIQTKINTEQEAAKARVAAAKVAPAPAAPSKTDAGVALKGKEMYVTATAYSPDESGSITAAGYNIDNNPNLKLIAVDTSVIPLGSKVWVEGYGVAIAGDTGGAINGNIIDVLVPNKEAAVAWGRQTVKIIILD